MPKETLQIAGRFCGPAGSANGGYFCGRVATLAAAGVTVRLLKPVPLETELAVERANGLPQVRDRDSVVAEARPGGVGALGPPLRPSFDEAVDVARRYAGFGAHPAPRCFVCGPRRTRGDGLCIFSGAITTDIVAAPWQPDASLDRGDGTVRDEFMWAALDCPGFAALAPDMRPMLLGELTAGIGRCARVDEPCTVVGWKIASSGRKHEAGTAVLGRDAELLATARAVWIEPRSS
jgi:hypothetical protein